MCRITGILEFTNRSISQDVLIKMRDSLSAGGPDSAGIFIDGMVGLAHRRLSIIDLSESGSQPMIWGKWVISYNGEIYNYKEVKEKLIRFGYSFNTQTDTEVIIKAFDHWGIDAMKRFRGMFAFALWDKEKKKLTLCRDRLGVKPLYWYYKNGLFLFASEIKAFHQHPSFDKNLNLSSLPHYLKKGYFHADESIYKYVKKVPPGSLMEIDSAQQIKINPYWDIQNIYENSVIDSRPEDEILEDLEPVLAEAFSLRMVADVEVGMFLSGGIDSTLVAALLQRQSSRPLQTFTIGFQDKRFNEAEVASEVANQLGTTHSTLYCTESEFKSVIPELSDIYDEPFGDASAIPTYLVSKLARKKVKVALSGDGGDELFGGYSRYKFARHSSSILSIPYPLRKVLHKLSYLISPVQIMELAAKFNISSYSQVGDKYFKFQQILLATDIEDFFEKSSSYSIDHHINKLTKRLNLKTINGVKKTPKNLISFLGMKYILTYVPGDILTKVDRASMCVALESREPFLDPEIIKFAFTIPDHLKISEKGENKYLLRKILSKYISPELLNRPKQGFSVPIEKWLHGFLKAELLEIGNDQYFFEVFEFDKNYFSQILKSFFGGENKHNPQFIWFIYCLYNWYVRWVK